MISVGIDIGGSSVKLAEIHATSKSYSVIRFQEFPLSSDPTKDKKIEVLDILRKIAAGYDPDSTHFILALHQSHATLRYRNFPFKERFKILRSVPFELEDDIPFNQEESVFDAKITRYVESAADVLACAAPKEHIKDLVSLAREAGLEPHIVTVEGLALANLIEDWQSPPPQMPQLAPTPEARSAEFILDIGHTRSVLVLASEGTVLTARNIDFGGKNIADTIASRYNIHYLEALKELQKKGFVLLSSDGATREQVAFSDVIKQALEPLVQEVQFSLLEMASARNVRFTKAHLTGGASQIKNLGPFLTQKWEVSVNRLKHFHLYPQLSIDTSPAVETISAVAIGIAIEGLRKPRNPAINLLQGEFAKQADAFKNFVSRWGYASKLAATAFVCLLVYGFLRENFALELNDRARDVLKEQATSLTGGAKAPSTREIRRFIKQKKDEISARKIAKQVRGLNSALDILNEIHQSSPSNKEMLVELRKFKVENEIVEIHGEVARADHIGKFRQALSNVAADGKVDQITPTFNAGPGKQAFAFRLRVDRLRGG